ncbi:MAG: restriction endonuclease subunit S [Acidobacteria bacterium]|nr:restriction endonuclease subunit S [Acidobacteriota bacterium]MCW5971164.1 restriction endonuclease subunit S [Blastocatellales bacterium]
MKRVALGEALLIADSGTWGDEGHPEHCSPVLRSSNIQDYKMTLSNHALRVIPPKDIDRKRLHTGDIIVTASSGSPELIGKCALFSQPDLEKTSYYFSNFTLRLRTNSEKLDSRYLYHWLISHEARAYLSRINDTTSGLRNLNKTLYLQQLIPLPPLIEQRRIAAILDKADALREKRREAITELDELVRSFFFELFGDPLTNPKGWPRKNLGQIASFIGGGTPRRDFPAYYEGDICWATSKDMKGEILRDTQEHITEEAIANSATKLVMPGTIMIVVKSKILMHTLPVLISAVPTCFGQDLKGIQLRDHIPPSYVARHLRIGSRMLLELARGVNTEGLTLDHLKSYKIMIPSDDLLERYESFENQIAKLKEKSLAGQQKFDDLFKSLQQRAFNGELSFTNSSATITQPPLFKMK